MPSGPWTNSCDPESRHPNWVYATAAGRKCDVFDPMSSTSETFTGFLLDLQIELT